MSSTILLVLAGLMGAGGVVLAAAGAHIGTWGQARQRGPVAVPRGSPCSAEPRSCSRGSYGGPGLIALMG